MVRFFRNIYGLLGSGFFVQIIYGLLGSVFSRTFMDCKGQSFPDSLRTVRARFFSSDYLSTVRVRLSRIFMACKGQSLLLGSVFRLFKDCNGPFFQNIYGLFGSVFSRFCFGLLGPILSRLCITI